MNRLRFFVFALVLMAGALAMSGCDKDKQPQVNTIAATDISTTSAKLNAEIVDEGSEKVTNMGFYYSTDKEMGNKQTVRYNGYANGGKFSTFASNLQPATTYYFQAFAENGKGIGVGEIMSFATTNDAQGGGSSGGEPSGGDTPAPTQGQLNGHAWVDLGLPSGTRWASCNMGANAPEQYGDYYAWGETVTKEVYDATTYTYSDNPETLPASADAASVGWGSDWRMPTSEEFQELLDNCTHTWALRYGVKGCMFTGTNGNFIFLPASGSRLDGDLNFDGTNGWYRSSSLYADYTYCAWSLSFSSESCVMSSSGSRAEGQAIRPVYRPDIPPATVTVTFNANGGSGTMEPQTFTVGVAQQLNANGFTRSGYSFSGWNTSVDGTGTAYSNRQEITVSANLTLYAQWTANPVAVTFNANGGSGTMSPQTFTVGVAQQLTANSFTRSGYSFSGWNTSANGSGTSYSDRQSITISADITLYAQWTSNTVTVTFNANGGSGTMSPQTFTIGVAQALTANSFTRTDYVFSGWNTAANGSGTSYSDRQSITISSNLTLYAQWRGTTGTLDGHDWVDFGLPSGMRWATCNLGADSPTAYGNYYAWGETSPKSTYNSSTYTYNDNPTTLPSSVDAATANWGSNWRMPTKTEFEELKNNCTVTWTTQSGVSGLLFTGTNGNSIFLPAVGDSGDSGLYTPGASGNYWSSSNNMSITEYVWSFGFISDGTYDVYVGSRYNGFAVRAVCNQ